MARFACSITLLLLMVTTTQGSASETSCPPSDYKCNNGEWIDKNWICDGDKDCPDGEDEDNCPEWTCSSSQYKCNNGKCIRARFVCNGFKNCRDGSDESGCDGLNITAEIEGTSSKTQDFKFKEGDYVYFRCELDIDGPVGYSWFIDDDWIPSDNTNPLELKLTAAHNGQTIRCEAEAYIRTETKSIDLTVEYAPKVNVITNARNLKAGDRAVFYCDVDANPMNLSIEWYLNHKIPGQSSKSYELTLRPEHNGQRVMCEVINKIGSDSGSMKLDVSYLSMESRRWFSIPSLGEKAELYCEASGNPEPSVSWTKQGSESILAQGVSNVRLTIESVTEESLGFYLCTATLPGLKPVSELNLLTLSSKPFFIVKERQWAYIGKPAVLECNVYAYHIESVAWHKSNGLKITKTDSRFKVKQREIHFGYRTRLSISDVKKEDFGFYTCSTRDFYRDLYSKRIQLVETR